MPVSAPHHTFLHTITCTIPTAVPRTNGRTGAFAILLLYPLPVVAAISFADNGSNARDRKVSMLMGKVFLPSDAPWLGEFERELTGFPGGRYDDQVDSTTQALEFLGTKGASAAIWAALAR